MPKNPNERQANAVDGHVGLRVRELRRSLRMSQERLASEIGLTFQQVQKYEKGMNRISCSKLFEIAAALGRPIQYFFDEMDGVAGVAEDRSGFSHDFFDTPEGRELTRAFPALTQQQQRAVLDLIRSFSSPAHG